MAKCVSVWDGCCNVKQWLVISANGSPSLTALLQKLKEKNIEPAQFTLEQLKLKYPCSIQKLCEERCDIAVENQIRTAPDLKLYEPVASTHEENFSYPSSLLISPQTLPMQDSYLINMRFDALNRLNSDQDKKTFEAIFSMKGEEYFQVGDSIGIWVAQMSAEVTWLLSKIDLRGFSPDDRIECQNLPNSHITFPSWLYSLTPRLLLTYFLDIHCLMKAKFLTELASFAKDPIVNEKEILSSGMTFMDTLWLNPKCRPPLSLLIKHLPALKPRAYSLINLPESRNEEGRQVFKIVFNLCEMPDSVMPSSGLPRFPRSLGITTGHLFQSFASRGVKEVLSVAAYVRKNLNGFRFPVDASGKTVFMIGPGTGIAPFLGFMEKKRKLMADTVNLPTLVLIHGCRNPEKNLPFESELIRALDDGSLDKAYICFSRHEGAFSAGKLQHMENAKHVQDILTDIGDELATELVNKGAIFMVCGDAVGMAPNVKRVVQHAVAKLFTSEDAELKKELADQDAKTFIRKLIRDKRYIEDVWA